MGERATQAKVLIVSIFLAGGISCGTWQRVGSSNAADPGVIIPELFDPSLIYRRMGMITQDAPFPFVASIHFLAGADERTTFGAFSLSLSNEDLSFRRRTGQYEARYGVELTFRTPGGRVIQEVVDSQTVIVETLQETMRGDETVIYQRFIPLPSGAITMNLKVKELGANITSSTTTNLRVPDFDRGPSLSSMVPVYSVDVMRSNRELFPGMLLNPRATIGYGRDTLRLYLEAYGAVNAVADVRAYFVENEEQVWADRVEFGRTGAVSSTLIKVVPDSLPVGELRFEAVLEGTADTVKTAAMVGFSEMWALSNFEDVLSLLRYFAPRSVLDEMRVAPLSERGELWRRFWRSTDRDPSTPQHEALEDYFARVRQANEMFREQGTPGWLTDRGEVYLLLGGPDETFEPFPDPASPSRVIQWSFIRYRFWLQFVDQTGFGDFRLTEASRADMMRILRREGRDFE